MRVRNSLSEFFIFLGQHREIIKYLFSINNTFIENYKKILYNIYIKRKREVIIMFKVFYLDDFNQKHLAIVKNVQELRFLIDRFGKVKILKN